MRPDDVGLVAKADGSPLTRADLAANDVILQGLTLRFPEVPELTEEALPEGAGIPAAERVFLVDPLDGTRIF